MAPTHASLLKWKRFQLCLLGVLLMPLYAPAQSSLDSLRALITQTPDSLLAPQWLAVSEAFETQEEPDSALHYAWQAHAFADSFGDTFSIRASLYQLSPLLRNKGDSTTADSLFQQAVFLQAYYGFQLNEERNGFNNAYIYSPIRSSILSLVDSSRTLTFDSILQMDLREDFIPNYYQAKPEDSLVYWGRMRVHGFEDSTELALFMLGIDNSTWDTIDLYLPNESGGWKHQRTGLHIPPAEKTAIKDWRSFFQLPIEAGSDKLIYFRLAGISTRRGPPSIFLALMYSDYLSKTEVESNRNMAVFFWILMVQAGYFLLLYLSTRERTYLPYLVYLSGVILFAFTAYRYHDLFPTQSDYDWLFIFSGICIAGLGLLSFAIRYLNLKELLPWWHQFTRIFMVLFAIPPGCMVLLFLAGSLSDGQEGPEIFSTLATIMVSATFLMISLGLIVTVLLGAMALRKGYRPAASYLVGMVILIILVGITPSVAIFFPIWLVGLLTFSAAVLAAQVGVVLQLIVFALGVGQKINLLEQEHEQALIDKLEAEQEANEKLRQSDRLKDEFLANTSHELRTPLNGIMGLSEAIYDGITGPTTPEMQENLSMVISSARRLSGLVSDLLDFSKLRNFELDLQNRPLDFRPLAKVVMKVSESMLGGKSLQLITEVPTDLPAILADENRLQQILYNLIGNAIKFTETGSITLKAESKGERVLISVIDTGIGIAAEKHEAIFRSFEQADGSTAREYGGTGLGLSITRQLVELHGGSIMVDSRPDQGSTFSFDLPTATEIEKENHQFSGENRPAQHIELPLAVMQSLPANASVAPHQVQAGQYHILVVDDEPINRQVLKNHLSTEKYWVTTAMNGEEALEAIESGQHFDLVLLDVMMPRLSGFEVCQKIRERFMPSELPVIMVTAKNQVSDLVTGLAQGANDYIVKPFSKQELLARLKTHLNLLRIHAATSRFVPYEFLRSLGREAITDVRLGDQVQRNGTVLFSDIRGYTQISEHMGPEQTFAFLNAYLGRMGPVIQDNQGFVNQFYGDGIMALFLEEPLHGLQAAIQMIQTLNVYNEQRAKKGRAPLRIGIGLHTGSLMMGMIGDLHRLDTGLVSDTVNTTSRLENLTKPFGAEIVLSEAVFQQIPGAADQDIRFLGRVQLMGKNELIGVYECFAGNPPELASYKRKTKQRLHHALEAYYRQDFSAAIQEFEQLLQQMPEDLVVARHLKNARNYLEQGVDGSWTGAEEMLQK